MRIIDIRNRHDDVSDVVGRAAFNVDDATAIVRPILEAVRDRGQEALAEFSEKFDHIIPATWRVPADSLRRAADNLDPSLRHALEVAIDRRRRVAQEGERDDPSRRVTLEKGAYVDTRLIPVERVGLYVPGGLAPLASTVIHNVVPAQVAGVASIAVATPPGRGEGGLPSETILATCYLLGVDEVYAVGGAQAIAMFGYGVEGVCPAVDLITGPGNIYVVAAKRLIRSVAGIDAEAGPTEIAILADETANVDYVAADLLSQAEHDPLAASVLVTDSERLAHEVSDAVERYMPTMKHHERMSAALSGEQSSIILTRDVDQSLEVINGYGAEHLEIHTADAHDVAHRVKNAGAIFVGSYSPVPLGDYLAGSTHVLPTGRAAHFSSGLTVRSFMKTVHVISYSREAFMNVAEDLSVFACAEDLPAHAYSATVRGHNNPGGETTSDADRRE